jgi:hypothetical protein
MTFSAADLGAALAAHECFASARTVVDVGGGQGVNLAAILDAHPHLHGILFDRAAMLEEAVGHDRCEPVAGDFFESVPQGDVYVLSWILHDWNDEQALRIISACRAAAGDHATLLIAEVLLPDQAKEIRDNEAIADPFTLDMQMLLLTGGCERTEPQYRALLGASGFEVTSVSTPASTRGVSIITAGI